MDFQKFPECSYTFELEGLEFISTSKTDFVPDLKERISHISSLPENDFPFFPNQKRKSRFSPYGSSTHSYSKSLESIDTNSLTKYQRGPIPFIMIKYKNSTQLRISSESVKSNHTFLLIPDQKTDIGTNLFWLKMVSEALQVDVCTFDYTGCGLHKGKISEEYFLEDLWDVFRFLCQVKNIPSQKIILVGKKFGCRPSAFLLSQLSTLNPPKDNRRKFIQSISSQISKSLELLKTENPKCENLKNEFNNFGNPCAAVLIEPNEKVWSISSKISDTNVPIFLISSKENPDTKKIESKIAHLWKSQTSENFDEDFLEISVQLLEALSGIKKTNLNFKKLTPKKFENPKEKLENWLKQIQMENFTTTFIEFGFYESEILKTLSEIDLEGMGVPSSQFSKILNHIPNFDLLNELTDPKNILKDLDSQELSALEEMFFHSRNSRKKKHNFILDSEIKKIVLCSFCQKNININLKEKVFRCTLCSLLSHSNCLEGSEKVTCQFE